MSFIEGQRFSKIVPLNVERAEQSLWICSTILGKISRLCMWSCFCSVLWGISHAYADLVGSIYSCLWRKLCHYFAMEVTEFGMGVIEYVEVIEFGTFKKLRGSFLHQPFTMLSAIPYVFWTASDLHRYVLMISQEPHRWRLGSSWSNCCLNYVRYEYYAHRFLLKNRCIHSNC